MSTPPPSASAQIGKSPEDNLADGRQTAQKHYALYDAIHQQRETFQEPTLTVEAINRQVAQDAEDRDIRDIKDRYQGIRNSITAETDDFERRALASKSPVGFAELREQDPSSALRLVQKNLQLVAVLEQAVAMLENNREIRRATSRVPFLEASVKVLREAQAEAERRVNPEMQEKLIKSLEQENLAKDTVAKWQSVVLQQGFGVRSNVRFDIGNANETIQSKQVQQISTDTISKAAEGMRACLRDYPVGPERLSIEILLRSTGDPTQFNNSVLLALLEQEPSDTDVAFLHLTVASFVNNSLLVGLERETSSHLACPATSDRHSELHAKNIIAKQLDLLEPKLYPDPIIKFILNWLKRRAGDEGTKPRPQELLEDSNVAAEERFALKKDSEFIAYGSWILFVTPTYIRWLRADDFHLRLDDDLIESRQLMLVHQSEKENSDLESKLSIATESFDLSTLARVLLEIKVKTGN